MTLKEWLKLNPNHRASLAVSCDEVVAVLFGGDGIEKRWVGRGDEVTDATAQALEMRDGVRSKLP